MDYCNTAAILTEALTRVHDNSTDMRTRLLSWLNSVMRSVANYPRKWEFLKKSATIAIGSGVFALPSDFGRVRSVNTGDYLFVQPLSDSEVFQERIGFTVGATSITLHELDDVTSIDLNYTAAMTADYTDVSTATIFPYECQTYFVRALVSAAYEYDKDNDILPSLGLTEKELKQLRAMDNLRKPLPERSSRGYVTSRG